MHNPDIGIVIVTWDGWPMLQQCLQSIQQQTVFQRIRVLVVDNGSKDGTLEGLRKQFPSVVVMQLPTNTGFASPNNLGIAKLLENPNIQYVLTLNNDITITPTFVEEMLACSQRHPSAGSIQG